jgi:hypothetical protein
MLSGCKLIEQERRRQQIKEKFTNQKDDKLVNGELRDGAIRYAMVCDDRADLLTGEELWKFPMEMWKPTDDRIRNLVKAGAMIAAEIDRLQRKASKAP